MTNFSDTRQTSVASKPMTATNISRQPLIPPATIRSTQTLSTTNSDDTSNTTTTTSSSSSPSRRQTNSSSRTTNRQPNSKLINRQAAEMANNKLSGQLQQEPEVWGSIEDLFWDHMDEVQNKWDTLKLNDDIWAKLIYFEQNMRLAKAYVSAPVLTIDGSTNGLDGFRIGLSGIDNTYRNLDSVGCLRSIGQGVKLKIDSQGNILIRKISQANTSKSSKCSSVWIRDWPSSLPANIDIDESCTMREIEQSDISYKLFDMRRFRHHLERLKTTGGYEAKLDWRQCVSIISFVRPKADLKLQKACQILDDPCWIMIINIIAIDMIKSIICDEANMPIGGSGSGSGRGAVQKNSALGHQHMLLNSHNTSGYGNKNMRLRTSGPGLKASSSTSVLYQPAEAPLDHNLLNDDAVIDGDDINMVRANNNRAKKVRTSNLRMVNRARTDTNHRRYQSTQQLSNNIIYTTFNSKYIVKDAPPVPPQSRPTNHHHHAYDLSTSDYYSGSRSTSTNGGYNTRQGLDSGRVQNSSRPPMNRLNHRPTGAGAASTANDRFPFARGNFVRQLEHNRSLSSFDLTLRKFDFKPIEILQSAAIRMNYDQFSGADEFFNEQDDEELSFHETATTTTKSSGSNNFNSENDETSKQQTGLNTKSQNIIIVAAAAVDKPFSNDCSKQVNSSQFVIKETNQPVDVAVNHNECQAMHNSTAAAADASNQVMSRSSSSSSSSSGCADNDYLMSNSSSSMSSSSASNERELLSSQPASSSGIACSGNTSDEYDDNNHRAKESLNNADSQAGKTCASLSTGQLIRLSPSLHTTKNTQQTTGAKSVTQPKPLSLKSNNRPESSTKKTDATATTTTTTTTATKSNPRRGYKIKTIQPNTSQDFLADSPEDFGIVCDCELSGCERDCCGCDCLIEENHTPGPLNCYHCDTESIYSCLPAPKQSLEAVRSSRMGANKRLTTQGKEFNRIKCENDEGITSDNGSAAPSPPATIATALATRKSDLVSEKRDDDREEKSSSPGWLEKRKYSRIFPKFIFLSSNSSRRIGVSSGDKRSNTQRKSTTLPDTREEKFRLTRSTQDLS